MRYLVARAPSNIFPVMPNIDIQNLSKTYYVAKRQSGLVGAMRGLFEGHHLLNLERRDNYGRVTRT